MVASEVEDAKAGAVWWPFGGERRFAVLLVMLGVLLVGSPLLPAFDVTFIVFDAMTAVALLAAIWSLCFERRQRVFALLLGVPAVLLDFGGFALPDGMGRTAQLLGQVCGVLFFLGAASLIVRAMLAAPTPRRDDVYGAVCGYLFLGLAWGLAYGLVETSVPNSFAIAERLRTAENEPQPYVLLYFSFVTLTTLGYGDVTPVSPAARTLAWTEAMTGQLYLAIVVAGLVSLLATTRDSD